MSSWHSSCLFSNHVIVNGRAFSNTRKKITPVYYSTRLHPHNSLSGFYIIQNLNIPYGVDREENAVNKAVDGWFIGAVVRSYPLLPWSNYSI